MGKGKRLPVCLQDLQPAHGLYPVGPSSLGGHRCGPRSQSDARSLRETVFQANQAEEQLYDGLQEAWAHALGYRTPIFQSNLHCWRPSPLIRGTSTHGAHSCLRLPTSRVSFSCLWPPPWQTTGSCSLWAPSPPVAPRRLCSKSSGWLQCHLGWAGSLAVRGRKARPKLA